MISVSSPTCQPTTDKVFANDGRKPRTDAQIQEFIADEIARFKSSCQSQKKPTVSLHQADGDLPPSRKNELPKTSTVSKDSSRQQSSSSIKAGPQLEAETLRIDASKSELIEKAKEREYPRIPSDVAATCTENKEDSSVVLTFISSMTCREVAENCSLLEEEHKSPLCGNRDVVPDVSRALGHILQKKENDPDFKNTRDSVTVTASSHTIQVETTADQQKDRRDWNEEFGHFMPKPSADKTRFGSAVPNQVKHACLPGQMGGVTLPFPALKVPQYDDVSEDEDKPNLRAESYKDLSKNKIPCSRNAVEEMTSLQPETCDESEHPSRLECVGETDLELQINYSFSSCSVLEGDDDDEDDDWAVLPVQILDLKLEQAESIPQDDRDKAGWDGKGPGHGEPALKPVAASAFQQMEVFDSRAEQEQAVRSGPVSYVIVPSCSSIKQKSHESNEESHSEPEDSYETDDSSDYSCSSERNYMTASRTLVQNLSTPKATHFLTARAWGGENCSSDITITIDSDTESENDCMEIGVENPPPLSEDSGADFRIGQKGLSADILEVQGKIQITSPPSVDSPASEHDVSLNLSQDTETLNQVQNEVVRRTFSNDENVIIITSDSDDDDEAKSPSTWESVDNSNKYSLNQKNNTTTAKRMPQDPRPPSGDSSKLRSISRRPGKIHTSNQEVKINLTASEDSGDPLTDPGTTVCVKKGKVQKTPSLGDDPVVARMLVQTSPLTERVQLSCAPRVQRQDEDESMLTSNSLTGTSKDASLNQSRHSLRDDSGRFTSKPKPSHGFVQTALKTSNQNSLPHDRHVSSAKRQRSHSHNSSAPPLTPRTAPTSSSVKRSTQRPNHARTKIFRDWQKNHVPIRRERKAPRRTNDLRHSL